MEKILTVVCPLYNIIYPGNIHPPYILSNFLAKNAFANLNISILDPLFLVKSNPFKFT